MKEQSHLEAWLHTAEQAVSGARLGNLPYLTAKEELRKFEVNLQLLTLYVFIFLFFDLI